MLGRELENRQQDLRTFRNMETGNYRFYSKVDLGVRESILGPRTTSLFLVRLGCLRKWCRRSVNND